MAYVKELITIVVLSIVSKGGELICNYLNENNYKPPKGKYWSNAAVKIIEKYGFITNDLYKLSISLSDTAHSDPVHYYTPKGTESFTNQVLSFIAPALGMDEIPEYAFTIFDTLVLLCC